MGLNKFKYDHVGKHIIERASYLKKPKVLITTLAYKKMRAYISECDKEIGWLGTIREKSETEFILEDTYLFKQQVHSATCEITSEGLTEFTMDLYAKYDDDTAMDISNSIQLWGHSHVRMTTSPSSQDISQLSTFRNCGHEYFIGVIGNKQGDLTFTLQDYRTGIVIRDIDWELYIPELDDDAIVEEVKKEIEEKVSLLTPARNWGNHSFPRTQNNGFFAPPTARGFIDGLGLDDIYYLDDPVLSSTEPSKPSKSKRCEFIEDISPEDIFIEDSIKEEKSEENIAFHVKDVESIISNYINSLPKKTTPKKTRDAALKELDEKLEMLPIILKSMEYGDLIDLADEAHQLGFEDVSLNNDFVNATVDYIDYTEAGSSDDEVELTNAVLQMINFMSKYIELF